MYTIVTLPLKLVRYCDDDCDDDDKWLHSDQYLSWIIIICECIVTVNIRKLESVTGGRFKRMIITVCDWIVTADTRVGKCNWW